MKIFILLALSALAALASSQTPTTVYASAQREPHVNQYLARPDVEEQETLHLDPGMSNWFTVTGDAATSDATGQTIPWGMTWANLTHPNTDHWVYTEHFDLTVRRNDFLKQTNDYYTINKNYKKGTDDADPSNGDDIVVEGATTWVRTCDSLVTNDIDIQVVRSA